MGGLGGTWVAGWGVNYVIEQWEWAMELAVVTSTVGKRT